VFTKTMFQTLFAYQWHIDSRLLDLASQLNDADYHEQTGYSQGSIHQLLFHVVRTMNSWRMGVETGKRVSGFRIEDFPTLDSVQTIFQQEKSAWQAFLDKLSEQEIEGDISLTTRSGEMVNIPRWRILNHLVLHGMQHHAELAHLLTLKGKSPGDIDFIFYG